MKQQSNLQTHTFRPPGEVVEEKTEDYRGPTVDAMNVYRSKERLELLAGRALKSKEAVMEALEKFNDVLVEKQITCLKEFYG